MEQNDKFKQWFEKKFEFGNVDDATFKISEYRLKQMMEQSKFENVKIIDAVKKHKWNCIRCDKKKTWYGIRIREIDEDDEN